MISFMSVAFAFFAGEALGVDESLESHASLGVSISAGNGKPNTKKIVTSLKDVSEALKKEDEKALTAVRNRTAKCKQTDRSLQSAMDKAKRSIEFATNDYVKADAQVKALQASNGQITGKVSACNTEIDMLQARLKEMRAEEGLRKKGAGSVLREMDAAITKTYLREKSKHRTQSASEQHGGQSVLEEDSLRLERLSKGMALVSDATETTMASVSVLKADEEAVKKASDVARKGYFEKEKEVMDLIDAERKKLSGLEDNLRELQPAISNKLKEAMEINRTLDAAERSLERDAALMKVEGEKCSFMIASLGEQRKQRAAAINDVDMATQILMRPSGLRASLLQTAHDSQEISSMKEVADAWSEGSGDFDGVPKMIKGLIVDLKAKANAEKNENQFCQDNLGKNRRQRVAKQNSIDTLAATIRWSKIGIVRLDDDLKYLEDEKKRLAGVIETESEEQVAEKARVEKEFAAHKLSDKVVTTARAIVQNLCGLKADSASLPGMSEMALNQRKHLRSSRFSPCQQAADLLKSTTKAIAGLDDMTKVFLKAYLALSESIKNDGQFAWEARESELKAAKAARAERAWELATASKDSADAETELALIEEAKKELEHRCSHVVTREEKLEKRAKQIKDLQEALKSLEKARKS